MTRRKQARPPARIPKVLRPYLRRSDEGDVPEHRAWVRSKGCVVANGQCAGQMQAHHVRNAANAGTGMKPHDMYCVGLCSFHHDLVHRIGVETFDVAHGISLAVHAERLADASPALRRKRTA